MEEMLSWESKNKLLNTSNTEPFFLNLWQNIKSQNLTYFSGTHDTILVGQS